MHMGGSERKREEIRIFNSSQFLGGTIEEKAVLLGTQSI